MEKIEFTPDVIKGYILSKLEKNMDFLFNELDLQMFVARALAEVFSKNYKIHLEYHLPKGWKENFDKDYSRWGTEKPYFDIVLEKNEEKPEEAKFIAIELKYKLKKVKLEQGIEFKRFGISSPNKDITLVTNQSASNEGRYDFWKDVKRLELLKEHFGKNVVGGIALFVTNEKSYTSINSEHKYSKFNFEEKEKSGFLYWYYGNNHICGKEIQCGDTTCKGTPCGERLKKTLTNGTKWTDYVRPNFKLKGKYLGKWHPSKAGFEGPMKEQFYCYSVII